jgi:hypothetical protein
MKYLFLLYTDEAKQPTPGSPEFDKQNEAYGAFFGEASKNGAFQSGDPVQPSSTAKTVRLRGGNTESTPGPHSNGSAEQLIGFYVLDCPSESEAVSYASRIPAAATGSVEVRPILQM